jgi:hypothetical protein
MHIFEEAAVIVEGPRWSIRFLEDLRVLAAVQFVHLAVDLEQAVVIIMDGGANF